MNNIKQILYYFTDTVSATICTCICSRPGNRCIFISEILFCLQVMCLHKAKNKVYLLFPRQYLCLQVMCLFKAKNGMYLYLIIVSICNCCVCTKPKSLFLRHCLCLQVLCLYKAKTFVSETLSLFASVVFVQGQYLCFWDVVSVYRLGVLRVCRGHSAHLPVCGSVDAGRAFDVQR